MTTAGWILFFISPLVYMWCGLVELRPFTFRVIVERWDCVGWVSVLFFYPVTVIVGCFTCVGHDAFVPNSAHLLSFLSSQDRDVFPPLCIGFL